MGKITEIQAAVRFVPLDMKGCVCHFTKWQIHPFISKGIYCVENEVCEL